MINNQWHKKEKPLLGLLGSGGGMAQSGGGGASIDATGGTKSAPGDGYTYHLFTSSGSLVINSTPDPTASIDCLVVGGGAGGGFDRGGGGGAGAFRPLTLTVNVATHPVTIGAAGAGGVPGSGGAPGRPTYNNNGGGGQGGDTTLVYGGTPSVSYTHLTLPTTPYV